MLGFNCDTWDIYVGHNYRWCVLEECVLVCTTLSSAWQHYLQQWAPGHGPQQAAGQWGSSCIVHIAVALLHCSCIVALHVMPEHTSNTTSQSPNKYNWLKSATSHFTHCRPAFVCFSCPAMETATPTIQTCVYYPII